VESLCCGSVNDLILRFWQNNLGLQKECKGNWSNDTQN